jgi:hypothetical protein
MEAVSAQNPLLIIALLLVVFSAGTGLTLAVALLTKKNTAATSIFMHGVLSATGLILIVVYFIRHSESFPAWIVLSFVTTALLGFFMFWKDIRQKPVRPLVVVFAHILFALFSIISVVDWCFF